MFSETIITRKLNDKKCTNQWAKQNWVTNRVGPTFPDDETSTTNNKIYSIDGIEQVGKHQDGSEYK